MSLSLSSLLNPSPDSETREPNISLPPLQPLQSPEALEKRPSSSAHSNQAFPIPPAATHEAAQALAKLSASPVAPPSQWNGYHAPDANQLERQRSWERRSSGFGDHSITLPPPVSAGSSRKMSSPTLEQYQVASRSPEQRRASIVPPHESNGVTLPPLQGFNAPSPRVSKPEFTQSSPPGAIQAGAAPLPASEATDGKIAVSHASEHAPPPQPSLQTSTAAVAHEAVTSPAIVKQETVSTPQPSSPAEVRRPSDVDTHTSKTVASLKNEHSIKTQSPLREASIPIPSTETAVMEAPVANPKKRPAPSKKKGTASTVKKDRAPPSKKRKVELRRSATPSSVASKPPTIKGNSTKGTPANSSPAPSTRSYSAEPNEEEYDEDEDVEDGSDGNVYCLCRKPDNGTFMIGCDGTCDDWFHGKCVGMEERDKNLIDKYICPDCTKKGVGQTTWKRMCRRSGCRQPAKVGKTKQGAAGSKYCSDECGVLYFREMAARTRGQEDSARNRASRRKSSMIESEKTMVEDELGARGGALSAGEVKALLNVSMTAEEFKKLGDGVLSPPATPDGEGQKSQYNESETQALQRIQLEKEEARRRHAILKDRMKFVTLVKQAASRSATEKELKPKEFCGYDSRLEWTDQRFHAWRTSKAGQQAFELDTLQSETSSGKDKDLPDDDDIEEEVKICDRKKCARHLDWSKLAVDDIRCNMTENSDRMRHLDQDEREVKERAALRAQAGTSLSGEGTVEVHGLGIAAETSDKMDIDTDAAPLEVPSVAETVEKI